MSNSKRESELAAALACYEAALAAVLAEYKGRFPPGTISEDGQYRMGEDGKWYGRCTIVGELDKMLGETQ